MPAPRTAPPPGDELAQRYRAVFDTATVGIVELDLRGTVVEANPAFLRLGGWPTAEVVGRYVGRLVAGPDVAVHRPLWADLVAGRLMRYSVPTTLVPAVPRDVAPVAAHVVMTGVRGAGGRTVGAVAVAVPVGAATSRPSIALAELPRTASSRRVPAPAVERAEAPTAGELAVLRGLAAGLTLQQLAGRLGLTRRGVDYRLARLRHKLRAGDATGPPTTAGVVARGYALGLLVPDTWPPAPPRAG